MDNIHKVYTSSFLDANKLAMLNVIPDFYLEGQGRYMQVLQEAIMSAYEGYVSAEEALDYAASKWEEITDDIGRQSQVQQWHYLKLKYPKDFVADNNQ